MAQQEMLHRPRASELALQHLPRKPKREASALYDRAARRGFASHEEGNTDDSLIAHDGVLGGRAMTMTFGVKDKSLFDKLSADKKVGGD